MTKKNFSLIAGIIFAFVALVHLARLLQGWAIIISGSPIPLWVSAVSFFITAILAAYGLHFGLEDKGEHRALHKR